MSLVTSRHSPVISSDSSVPPPPQGAVAGLLIGLALNLWIGFAPKPPPVKLPVTSDLCRNETHVAGVVMPDYDDVTEVDDVINGTAAPLVAAASPLKDDR